MQMNAPDGQSFELHIVGYEFPENERDEPDCNWLIIEGKVSHADGSWIFRHPCLLTYEIAELADWLEAVAVGEAETASKTFVEPNIRFGLVRVDEGPAVCVFFELEARPSWAKSMVVLSDPLWVTIPVREQVLREAASSLRSHLERYPRRPSG